MGDLTGDRDDEASRFSTHLRRLDVETFAQLVTDLWVERGRSATREGATISVDGGKTTRRLEVSHRSPPATAGDVVVTSRLSDDPNVVDAAELLEIVQYAVERDRSAEILKRYLGSAADQFCSPHSVHADEPRGGDWRSALTSGPVVALVVVILLASVGLALTQAGLTPLVTSPATVTGDQGEAQLATTERLQSESVVQESQNGSENAPTSVETVSYTALGCPSPPTDVYPAELTPDVVPGASAGGLDGWQEVIVTNDSTAESDQLPTPTARHTVMYVPPSGHRLALSISLWQSRRVAQSAESAFAPRNETLVRWGQYTLLVSATTPDGEPLTREQTVDWSRSLLSEVRSSSGSRFGYRCVDSLLEEATTSTAVAGAHSVKGL